MGVVWQVVFCYYGVNYIKKGMFKSCKLPAQPQPQSHSSNGVLERLWFYGILVPHLLI